MSGSSSGRRELGGDVRTGSARRQVHVLKVVETIATAVSLLKDLDTLAS